MKKLFIAALLLTLASCETEKTNDCECVDSQGSVTTVPDVEEDCSELSNQNMTCSED